MSDTAAWLQGVAESASGSAGAVQQLLHAVRCQLGMDLAWTSDFIGGEQVFRFVDADEGVAAPEVGAALPLSGSFCARVLDGRVPARIPDARHEPATALLEVTAELQIGSYLGVPLLGPDGTATGMLCATSRSAAPHLSDRDLTTMRLLAQLLHDLQVRALDEASVQESRRQLVTDIHRAISGDGRWPVLQPIVDSATGDVVAYEGLTRFDSERTPAEWFDAAARVGLATELEIAAAASVLDVLRAERVAHGAAVSVNLSPETLVTADLPTLLADVDAQRVVVEMTEHCPFSDYALLAQTLGPWRELGLRLAVDDCGAGYASLRHVLMCRPDLLKLDMALVRDVDRDAVRQSLLRAVVDFAGSASIGVIAEGVETEEERTALRGLGVPLLQGYLIGRPAAP